MADVRKYVVANLNTGTARPNVYDDPERAEVLMDELNEEHGDWWRVYELVACQPQC